MNGRLRLERGPKENAVRPAVDPMLRSLAASYGAGAVAVILSGALGDGSSGALAIRNAGGTVIVQDPEDAAVPSMPESALRAVGRTDAVLTADAIGAALTRLADGRPPVREDTTVASATDRVDEGPDRPSGPPSGFMCPECHGPLWQVEGGDVVRYRCRVGHAHSEASLLVAQDSAVEAALWSALEALEERAVLLARIAGGTAKAGRACDRFDGAARDALDRAELLRKALGTSGAPPHALDLQTAE